MRAHADLPAVQEAVCRALRNDCLGTGDKPGLARKKAAGESGALHAIVAGTLPTAPAVQAMACGAICSIGLGSNVRDRLAPSLAPLALDAGAREADRTGRKKPADLSRARSRSLNH
jgi:hypothetical protein